MKRTALLLSTVLLLVAAAAVAVHAQDRIFFRHHGGPGGHDRAEMHAHFFTHLTEKLELTAEQQAAAKEQMAKVHAAVEPLFAEHEKQHEALRTALDNGSDATTVGELAIAAHATMQKIHAAHKEAMATFAAQLTPEQQEKFQQLKESRKEFHHRIVIPHE
jgi:Spy/CpxP family protein refolding chaperone